VRVQRARVAAGLEEVAGGLAQVCFVQLAVGALQHDGAVELFGVATLGGLGPHAARPRGGELVLQVLAAVARRELHGAERDGAAPVHVGVAGVEREDALARRLFHGPRGVCARGVVGQLGLGQPDLERGEQAAQGQLHVQHQPQLAALGALRPRGFEGHVGRLALSTAGELAHHVQRLHDALLHR
jgi:hypothetical protein